MVCLLVAVMLRTHCALAAPAAASPANSTTAAAPLPTTTSSAPPSKNNSAAPSTVTATAPVSAPPPKAAAAIPSIASTPPLVSNATAHPPANAPAKASAPPPKPKTNLTSPAPATAPPPKHAAHSPAKSVLPPTPAPAAGPVATPDLDPAQLTALHALKVNVSLPNPCKTSDDILLCDNANPAPHHLISLSLKDCAPTANLTTQALLSLSTLQSLALDNCSLKPVHVPKVLAESLKSFICMASLGRTSTNEKADKLSGVWLSTLTHLEELSVTDVEVSASGLSIIVQEMKDLTQLMVSRVNLPGVLPKKTWPSGLESIDLSGNSIRGSLPSQMRTLSQLKHLDLSDNQIKGVLPNIFGDLSSLQSIDLSGNQFSGPIPGSLASLRNCSHLDLSKNLLNGSIPANLTLIRTLRYLDLSQNELSGSIPFSSSFLNKLTTLKLGSNKELCYNHTALKSKFLTGIRNCVAVADESTAFAPAPGPATSDLSTQSGKSGHISKGAAAGIGIVVIVAAAAVVFVVRRWWKARDEVDEFENLRAQKDRP